MNLKITTEDGDVIFTKMIHGAYDTLLFISTDGKQYEYKPSAITSIEVEPFY